jgi:hypothetical protein
VGPVLATNDGHRQRRSGFRLTARSSG